MTVRAAAVGLLGLCFGALLACGDGTADDGGLEDEVVVFAASSLTDAFEALSEAFEALHPATEVRLSFASSAALAVQIDEGAPADVFASADLVQMAALAGKGRTPPGTNFATNLPVVVVPREGARVASFEGLAEPGLRLVLAGRDVPIGRYAREILASAGAEFAARVLANLKSEESNVRAVLTKVELGEADAGFVYTTDAAAGTVTSIAVPAAFQRLAIYPIAAVSEAKHPRAAAAWVAFVLSGEGQAILREAGFGAPPP